MPGCYNRRPKSRLQSREQIFVDKILDMANIANGALIFGQFLSSDKFDLLTFFVGVFIVLVLYVWSWYYLVRFY